MNAMRSALKRNFHVPLPAGTYELLRRQAARDGVPATELAREAIEILLRERERAAIAEGIAAYAREVAGTPDDLDTSLEATCLQSWSREETES